MHALALRLLGRRDYTSAELRDKLVRKGCSAEEVDSTVRDLAAQGVLDDLRVARAHARTAARVKGRGRLRIERELQARGIDRQLAHELAAEVSGDDEAAEIERILARKRLPARLTLADRRKIFQHLLRRGFPAEAIGKALKKRSPKEE